MFPLAHKTITKTDEVVLGDYATKITQHSMHFPFCYTKTNLL